MSLRKFFQKIDNSGIGTLVSRKMEIIKRTDPDRIYIENIRSFFNIPFRLAKLLCELAVREGSFNKKIGIACPNNGCGRIIKSFSDESEIPETIICKSCELEGEDHEFSTRKLERVVFYQLNRETDGRDN